MLGAHMALRTDDHDHLTATRMKRVANPNLGPRTLGSMTLVRPAPARATWRWRSAARRFWPATRCCSSRRRPWWPPSSKAHADGRLDDKLSQLAKPKLLIVHELGRAAPTAPITPQLRRHSATGSSLPQKPRHAASPYHPPSFGCPNGDRHHTSACGASPDGEKSLFSRDAKVAISNLA